MRRTIDTPDGRVLAVEDHGDSAGQPVLVHTGTPNSRLLYGPNVQDAIERGLRLISYDRPGYGGSSPQPGRTVADCAGDVRAICAALGIDRLAMWGISGGGPHVLACAALLPDLVTAAASLASPAPYGADGLDFFEGMGELNADGARLVLADETAARAQTDKDREESLATSADDLASELESLLTPTDAAVLSGELAEYLTFSAKDGLAPGSQGWWDDNRCLIQPWGFDPADITVPLLLLHGRQDMFVPFGHGEWLVAHIPGVEARLLDDDGHLTLLKNRVPEVHAWLAGHL
ncbi:MAG TPA: alpha/beta fold hydrolase [Streptosporangiaceae bacterium]|nr:alpha/beta fold hydrolase [Streptosporangiaceae bacterium]